MTLCLEFLNELQREQGYAPTTESTQGNEVRTKMSSRLLRSHSNDPSSVTTALELCAIPNPEVLIRKGRGGGITVSPRWPQVNIDDVSELSDVTYESIIGAFGPRLTQPFRYNPQDIEGWKKLALTKSAATHELKFTLFCEHWLVPMLRLMLEGIGNTYKIDLGWFGDEGEKGKIPRFETWPGVLDSCSRKPDFGTIHIQVSDRDTRKKLWILVAEAKHADRWAWEDRLERNYDNRAVGKFIGAYRQLAAYGCSVNTQYVAIVTPAEVCLCRLIHHGVDETIDENRLGHLAPLQIGIQGMSLPWVPSGQNRITILLGMLSWILSAMNSGRRTIETLGSYVRLNEWVVIPREGSDLYYIKISQIIVRELPQGAIVVAV